MNQKSRWILWLRWVAANALGELAGLGMTFAVLAWLLTSLGDKQGVGVVLLSFGLTIATGALEATLVGLAQWWAMHPWFPQIGRRDWWLATLVGAMAAYGLGYLPSTLMSLGEEAGAAPPTEPPQAIVLLLAAGLGAAAGAILSFAQWLVMRKKVAGAVGWIPANMLAWLVGMPVIFRGIDASQKGQPAWQSLLVTAGALLLAGAVVGAIHGAYLAGRLANRASQTSPSAPSTSPARGPARW